MTSTLLQYVQLLVGIGTLATMLFALFKFLGKPHTTLESRVKELEVKTKEINESLHQGNDRFRQQDEINELVFSILLAFVDFEIAYCHHTGYEHDQDLLRAKALLEKFLAKR